jgi:hypothetical protein
MAKTGSLKLFKNRRGSDRGSVIKKKGNFLLDFILVLSNIYKLWETTKKL